MKKIITYGVRNYELPTFEKLKENMMLNLFTVIYIYPMIVKKMLMDMNMSW